MTRYKMSPIIMIAGLLAVAPAFAQTTAEKQKTQDGNGPAMVGPGSAAYKQKTQDGNGPAMVGPGSAAYKQKTQDGNGPTMVGPGSKAFKQHTQSLSHSAPPTEIGVLVSFRSAARRRPGPEWSGPCGRSRRTPGVKRAACRNGAASRESPPSGAYPRIRKPGRLS